MVMMFVINPVYASVSLLLCLVLIIVLHFFSPARTANWGSISQAIIFHQVAIETLRITVYNLLIVDIVFRCESIYYYWIREKITLNSGVRKSYCWSAILDHQFRLYPLSMH